MLKQFLDRAAASLLAFCLLTSAFPAYAADGGDADGAGSSDYASYIETYDTQYDETTDTPVERTGETGVSPVSGALEAGSQTIRWDAVQNAQRYTVTLDNVLTARSPDFTYSTTALSRTVTLAASTGWQCMVTARLSDGSTVEVGSAEYTTAVLMDGRMLRAQLAASSATYNLAGTSGIPVTLRWASAEPSASPQYAALSTAPVIEEVLLHADIPFTAAAEGGSIRLYDNGADTGKSYQSDVSVRLKGYMETIPVGKLTVRTVSTTPSVTVGAVRLDLFSHRTGSDVQFAVSGASVLSAEIDTQSDSQNPHPDWFQYNHESGRLTLNPSTLSDAAKGTVRLRFRVTLEGYREEKIAYCTVTLTDTSPTVRLSSTAVVLHPDGREPFSITASVSKSSISGIALLSTEEMSETERKTYALNGSFTCSYSDGSLTLTPTDTLFAGSLLLRVSFPDSDRTVKTTLRVTTSRSVSSSISSSSISVYRTPYPQQNAVSVSYTMRPVNLACGSLRVVELDGSTERELTSLRAVQDGSTLTFTTNENTAAGTLRLRIYADGVNGYKSLSVRVTDKMPSVTLSQSGSLDISVPSKQLTLTCRLQNTTYTLRDALEVSLSNEKLAIDALTDTTVTVKWLGGLQKGVAENCTLTVRLPDDVTLTASFRVVPIQSTVVFALALEHTTLTPGSTHTVSVSKNATGRAIVWSSSDESVATVENGVVTAHAAGNAVITATAGTYTDTLNVHVTGRVWLEDGVYRLSDGGRYLTASELPTASAQSNRADQDWTLTHMGGGKWQVRASDGRVLRASDGALSMTWPDGSEDERFTVVVDGDRLTLQAADKSGSVTLSGNDAGLGNGSLSYETRPVVSAIKLPYTALTLEPGESNTLIPATVPTGFESTLVFLSSDISVAYVSALGKITARTAGTATITVRHPDTGLTAEVEVTVSSGEYAIPDGTYRLRLAGTEQYLTVLNGGTSNGTAVGTAASSDGSEQQFRVVNSDGVLYLYAMCSAGGNGKVLDVYRGNSATATIISGCTIDIWSKGDAQAQEWTAKSISVDGQFALLLASNSALALTGGSGKTVVQTYTGGSGQRWVLEAADAVGSVGDAVRWVNPLDVMTTTQGFGGSFSSSSSYWGHLAWDGIGSLPVYATASGIVQNILSTASSSGHGNIVLVRHTLNGKVFYSSYSHLKDGSITVKIGDTVSAGQTLGTMGATGNVTGRHLHFCVYSGGSRLPYSYCGTSFSASYRDYAKNYKLRYYDPIRSISSNGSLITQNYYG